jgi:hypothetical protein
MERIGLQLADVYLGSAQDAAEEAFAARQKTQEARHVSLCRSLARRYGDLDPPSRWLRMMERALLGAPSRSIQLMGLLGGDIMGDFILQRLRVSGLPDDVNAELDAVLEDEQEHIVHFLLHLPEELRQLDFLGRLRCIWVQLVLLVADLFETRRLGAQFRTIGLDPDDESVLCYLYYREKMEPLRSTGCLVMMPGWLVRLTAGKARWERAQAALAELS